MLQTFLLSTLKEFLKIKVEGFVTVLAETLQKESCLYVEQANFKRETAVTPSGQKSESGKKPAKGDKNLRSRSRLRVRKRSSRTKNLKSTRCKRHRRDTVIATKTKIRNKRREHRYHDRSRSSFPS